MEFVGSKELRAKNYSGSTAPNPSRINSVTHTITNLIRYNFFVVIYKREINRLWNVMFGTFQLSRLRLTFGHGRSQFGINQWPTSSQLRPTPRSPMLFDFLTEATRASGEEQSGKWSNRGKGAEVLVLYARERNLNTWTRLFESRSTWGLTLD